MTDTPDENEDQDAPLAPRAAADDPRIVETLPGLARIAAGAGWRTLHWMASETIHTGEEIVNAVAEGESPVPVVRGATHDAWTMVSQSLGLADDDTREGRGNKGRDRAARDSASRGSDGSTGPRRRAPKRAGADELRARGADLLHKSADVRFSEDTHPAFEHILDELTPDEARILRFLHVEGPQPSVDVRTSRPFGAGSELIADGLSMIGLQAGVRRLDRTKAYLNNLHRLGLIWFSREPVEPSRYQVVEVQPEVTAALKQAGRASKTVRRSIHLTAFGEDFCHTCLPADVSRSPAERPD